MLISQEYKKLNHDKHLTSERFGTQGFKHIGPVSWIMSEYGVKTVLDYGCGKASLKFSFPEDVQQNITCYDPCIDEHAARPEPVELVVCTDVLEHVEPECIEDVLSDIASLSTHYVYFNISTIEANKHLPDGRNAHLNVHPWQWWVEKLRAHFVMTEGELFPHMFSVICRNKNFRLC